MKSCVGFLCEKKKRYLILIFRSSQYFTLFFLYLQLLFLYLSLSLLIQDLLFTDEIDNNSTISPSPQHENTTFMTDEKMKKILMPKKIEF